MKLKLCVLTVAGLLFPLVQAFAHHSFAAEYDEKKVITLKGVVTKFEWMNPHVRFYVDVKDASGVVTNWDLELMSPNTLKRAGWDSHALKVGDEVASPRTWRRTAPNAATHAAAYARRWTKDFRRRCPNRRQPIEENPMSSRACPL